MRWLQRWLNRRYTLQDRARMVSKIIGPALAETEEREEFMAESRRYVAEEADLRNMRREVALPPLSPEEENLHLQNVLMRKQRDA